MALEIGGNPLALGALVELLAAEFGGELREVRAQEPCTVVACCDAARLKAVARRLKGHAGVGYETLNFIAGVDRVSSLEAVYHLYSWKTNTCLELHVELPREAAEVDTVTDVWPAADWHEREAWDMLGIRFAGHPDLRRILLKDDFVGHPLRKDYVDTAGNHPHG